MIIFVGMSTEIHHKIRTIKDLPRPKGSLLWGNLKDFSANKKHQILAHWAEEFGDVYAINLAGKKFIVSVNPELNEAVLKARPHSFRRYEKINAIFSEIGIDGVFNAEGEKWIKHRQPAAEALNVKNVKQYFPVIQDKSFRLLKKLKLFAQNGDSVEVQREFMYFTIDITTEIAFGYHLNTIENKADEFQRDLETIFPMINRRMTAPLPTWRWLKSRDDKALLQSLNRIEGVIQACIDQARETLQNHPEKMENPENFLQALLSDTAGKDFTDKEIYGNVFTMLLAGEDTTSNSISWAFYYLSQHPEIVAHIREEAKRVYPNYEMVQTNEGLNQLEWAKAVAQEAIRLKPTTPQLFMQVIQDVTLNDLLIKNGETIILQNMVPQLDDANFYEAKNFVPQRWMKAACPHHHQHQPNYLRAFGAGPRFCPGMYLALNEMTMIISAICKGFSFELMVDPSVVSEEFAFTMHPGNLLLKFNTVN